MGFPGGASGKEPTCNAGDIRDGVSILGQKTLLEEDTANSILAWRIPWTEEPGMLQSIGSQSRTQLKRLSMHVQNNIICKKKKKEKVICYAVHMKVTQYCKLTMCENRSVIADSLRPHGRYSLWNSLGQHTGVGRLSLLQGIFQMQRSNPGLLHHRQILYYLSHKGSPYFN